LLRLLLLLPLHHVSSTLMVHLPPAPSPMSPSFHLLNLTCSGRGRGGGRKGGEMKDEDNDENENDGIVFEDDARR
jgi:hypothetical protein